MFSFFRKKQKTFSSIIEDRHIEIAQKIISQIDRASKFATINVYDFKKMNYAYEYSFGAFSSATLDFPKVRLNPIGIRILEHAYILFCRDILKDTDEVARLSFNAV